MFHLPDPLTAASRARTLAIDRDLRLTHVLREACKLHVLVSLADGDPSRLVHSSLSPAAVLAVLKPHEIAAIMDGTLTIEELRHEICTLIPERIRDMPSAWLPDP